MPRSRRPANSFGLHNDERAFRSKSNNFTECADLRPVDSGDVPQSDFHSARDSHHPQMDRQEVGVVRPPHIHYSSRGRSNCNRCTAMGSIAHPGVYFFQINNLPRVPRPRTGVAFCNTPPRFRPLPHHERSIDRGWSAEHTKRRLWPRPERATPNGGTLQTTRITRFTQMPIIIPAFSTSRTESTQTTQCTQILQSSQAVHAADCLPWQVHSEGVRRAARRAPVPRFVMDRGRHGSTHNRPWQEWRTTRTP